MLIRERRRRKANLNYPNRPLDSDEITAGLRKIFLSGKKAEKIGAYAWVDCDMYDVLSQYTWWLSGKDGHLYARTEWTTNGVKHSEFMHRMVMSASLGEMIDHVNHEPLHNYRSNLRFSDYTNNNRNSHKIADNTSSRYLGVCWDKQNQKWVASITVNYVNKFLGYFVEEVNAAKERDMAAILFHGESASLNFPRESYDMTKITADRWNREFTSKYRGVHSRNGYFVASIRFKGKLVTVGNFDCEKDAALAYDYKARELLGDKAKLNFPSEHVGSDFINRRKRKHAIKTVTVCS